MSKIIGRLVCPTCEKGSFHVDERADGHRTYISVTCRRCGYEIGELDLSGFTGIPRITLEQEN